MKTVHCNGFGVYPLGKENLTIHLCGNGAIRLTAQAKSMFQCDSGETLVRAHNGVEWRLKCVSSDAYSKLACSKKPHTSDIRQKKGASV